MYYLLTKIIQNRVFSVALLLIPSSAFAGPAAPGLLIHAPLATENVPTLSGMMMIVFSLLLGVVAYRLSKQNKSGGSMAVILLGVAGLVSGTGGIKLMSDAYAYIDKDVHLTQASGGQVDIDDATTSTVINSTGITQQIITITPPMGQPGCPNFPNGVGLLIQECFEGLTLNNGESCVVDCDFNLQPG